MNRNLDFEFFNALMTDATPEQFRRHVQKYQEMIMWYGCAIREVTTKLEVLNEEFRTLRNRNPIQTIKSRIKKPMSIYEKMQRRGYPITLDAMMTEMHDIAGVRVICSFIDDIYEIADMLTEQDDIKILQRKDYIRSPKPNGYRSLHLVVEIPIFLSNEKKPMKVEVQIRTIAMDFWASLEHQIHYKKLDIGRKDVVERLTECADIIYRTDVEMQELQKELNEFENKKMENSDTEDKKVGNPETEIEI